MKKKTKTVKEFQRNGTTEHSTNQEAVEKRHQEAVTGKDTLFPLPDTPLGMACEQFVEQKNTIQEAKLKLEGIEKQVRHEMTVEGRTELTVTIGPDNYHFERIAGEESLRCAKITKSPRVHEPAPAGLEE